jgi:outer membrane protein assembly factor BamD
MAMVLLSSCSHYGKMMKSTNMDAKLEYAIKLYKAKKYYKALPIFEELITVYRGTKKAEQTYYYYAYTNYALGDYETASYDFDTYAKTYPNSEYAEECAYMHAYCYYEDSPNYSLDQTNTLKAINALQLFVDQHQHNSRLEECNKLIDQLRLKLETKDFENAKLYFHMDDFKAAITALKNVIKDYPSTKFREEAMFLVIKSGYQYAEMSLDAKKNERYNQTLASYGEFAAVFPESKYKKDAANIADDCRKRLEKYTAVN